jgi:predicted Zn-dependent protease
LELAHGLSPYRATITAGASNRSAALAQARSLTAEGRRRADVRAFAYAERIISPFMEHLETDAEVAMVWADIQQYRHDFTGAARTLDEVLQRQPQNDSARLMRAEVRLAQGRGRDALRDCLALVGRQSPWIWSACAAQAYATNGRLTAARQLLTAALQGTAIEGPRGAWAAGIMADLAAQAGDLPASESWLTRALAANPEDHVATIDLLDLWIAAGRAGQALELLRDRPVSDAYLIRKAEALAQVDPAGSRLIVTDLSRRFAEADALAHIIREAV